MKTDIFDPGTAIVPAPGAWRNDFAALDPLAKLVRAKEAGYARACQRIATARESLERQGGYLPA